MGDRCLVACLAVSVVALLFPLPVTGQESQLRTSWGDPNLEGVWTGSTLTPVERPLELVAEALAFNPDEWREEIPSIEELFDFVGEKLPSSLRDELDGLKQRLA